MAEASRLPLAFQIEQKTLIIFSKMNTMELNWGGSVVTADTQLPLESDMPDFSTLRCLSVDVDTPEFEATEANRTRQAGSHLTLEPARV
jgi:hypothetical protein